jgi:hypothetical protein
MLALVQHLVFILKISHPREEPRLEALPGFLLLLHLNIGRIKLLGAGYDHAFNLF